MKKEMTIFISEDADVSREIIQKYFGMGKITYGGIMPLENRDKITDFLKELAPFFGNVPRFV